MRPGTPGFDGNRLSHAREARSVSAIGLSGMLGVSRQSISQYEKGEQTPSPETFRRICEVLNFNEHFFLRPLEQVQRSATFFRSMSRATVSQRSAAKCRQDWLYELGCFLRTEVDLPPVSLPTIEVDPDPLRLSNDRIEQLAMEVRQRLGLGTGPISNLVAVLERCGILVARLDLGAQELSGLSSWVGGQPIMLLNNDKTAAHSRFDSGHEFAHLLFHKAVDQARFEKPGDFKLIESQAHRFAGAFLFPAHSFAAEVRAVTLDRLLALKPRWGVSIAAMIRRASDLEFISEDQYRRLHIAYARRQWRGFEPYDEQLKPEVPSLIRRSLQLLIDQAGMDAFAITAATGLSVVDVELLASIDCGTLFGANDKGSLSQAQIIPLQGRPRT